MIYKTFQNASLLTFLFTMPAVAAQTMADDKPLTPLRAVWINADTESRSANAALNELEGDPNAYALFAIQARDKHEAATKAKAAYRGAAGSLVTEYLFLKKGAQAAASPLSDEEIPWEERAELVPASTQAHDALQAARSALIAAGGDPHDFDS